MAVRLYHFTGRAAARSITTSGFVGESCWLSPDIETIVGEADRSALIAVDLDLTDAELDAFRRDVVEDEVWDDELEAFVRNPASSRCFVWYEVPTATLLANGRVRVLTDSERVSLMIRDDSIREPAIS